MVPLVDSGKEPKPELYEPQKKVKGGQHWSRKVPILSRSDLLILGEGDPSAVRNGGNWGSRQAFPEF